MVHSIPYPHRFVYSDTLAQDAVLPQGGALRSKNAAFFLTLQADGNLVAYKSSEFVSTNAFWSSDTANRGTAPFRLQLQADGNLVLFDGRNQSTWSSNTAMRGVPPLRLVLQDDRNLVLYDGRNQVILLSILPLLSLSII